MTEVLEGREATGCGGTRLRLELLDGGQARLTLRADWMGQPPLEVALLLRHRPGGSHSGALVLAAAEAGDGRPLALPPSDGPLRLEYVRVPPQPFTLLLWLARDAFYDAGTDLDPAEYDPPIEAFAPVARALAWLESPWKLEPEAP